MQAIQRSSTRADPARQPIPQTCPSVLVVEDDEDTRQILEETFRFQGFQVASAVDGRRGLERAREHRPLDLIVLDLSLPEMDGLQVLRCLRTDPETRSIPVLVFTAGAEGDSAQQAASEFRVRVLPKPAGPRDVLSAARQMLVQTPEIR